MKPRRKHTDIAARVTPAMLRWARKKAGLPLGESAHAIGVTPETLAGCERGIFWLSLTQAWRLAALYGYPPAAFYLPRPQRFPVMRRCPPFHGFICMMQEACDGEHIISWNLPCGAFLWVEWTTADAARGAPITFGMSRGEEIPF